MKKTLLRITSILLACALLAGCSSDKSETTKKKKTKKTSKETSEVTDPTEDPTDETPDTSDFSETETPTSLTPDDTDAQMAFLDPEIKWWQLYNPNGFDTFTGIMYNPNNVPIDVSYDLVFYKDGQEVSRSEDWSNFSIDAFGESVMWGNWEIPVAEDVDEVKMENIRVGESYYPPVKAKWEFTEEVDNKTYFNFEFEKKITAATIWFFLYNDYNGNGRCDAGELDSTSIASLTEQKGTVYFETHVMGDNYTAYEVFYAAY